MNKKTIINLISFVLAFIAFGLYYFYFAISEYGPGNLVIAFMVSLFFAFFIGLWTFIIVKMIFLKLDSDFAIENEKAFKRTAINYFEKHKLSDGAYIQIPMFKKTIGEKIYFYFICFLMLAVLIGTFFESQDFRIYSILGLLILLIGIISRIDWFLRFLIKEPRIEANLIESPIKIYHDRITILNSGEELYFKDTDWIEFYYYYGMSYLLVYYKNKLWKFNVSSEKRDIIRLFEYFGFEKIDYKVKSRSFLAIPIERSIKYSFSKSKNLQKNANK